MAWRAHGFENMRDAMGPLCIAAIFAVGFLGFIGYTVGVLYRPLRALLETSKPIFIVDGYIRTRVPDEEAEGAKGYIAVLSEDHRVVFEWPAAGKAALESTLRPAHVEFSEYGGIHRIDGRSTGVLPESLPTLGIGATVGMPKS